MIQLLRSLVYTGLLFLTIIVYAIVVVLISPFRFEYRERVAHNFVAVFLWLSRHVCGMAYHVEGLENLPSEPCVVYIKHSSVWETLAQLDFLPWLPAIVLKRELMWIPIFGWALAALRPIAIDRAARHSAVQQVLQQGRERLAGGMSVSIFPEGTRMAPGLTRRYGLSGAILASESGVPLIPIAHNAGDLWPRRAVLKKPGTARVVIGRAIETAGRDPKDINADARQWMDDTMATISPAHQPLEHTSESGTGVTLGR